MSSLAQDPSAVIVMPVSQTTPDWFTGKKKSTLIVARWVPLTLVGLPVLTLLAIVIYPTIWMFYHSFQNTNMIRLFREDWSYVGWQNFATVFQSERFTDSVQNLALYLTFGTGVEVLLGTIIALILYEVVKSNFIRTVVLILVVLPMMLPPSIVGVLWKFLLTPSNGAVNHALMNLGIIDTPIEWFNAGVSLWTIIIADVWNWTALPLLIIYSGRVSLPSSIYEAARVDGASGWKTLTRITLPMLKEVIAIAFIVRFMDAFKFVDLVYVMTSGGPAQSSELPAYIAFQRGIREFNIGEAAAYSIVIFAFSAIIITLFLKYLKKVLKAQAIA
ncbi:N-Acetyl-D-glucosamine ABC transport system, permease protein 1 [hydrothermal vent metagenome]|uniref:N-Acetyl-D-glucosamine ABC transport system, permease protein 1 n=1 Tax=hydrothermal vent metagenome TaxID=652676 RepID=A0A3B0U5X7_9ZZZZ